jgi:hypothetical protein
MDNLLQALINDAPYEVGKTYFFRCVTFHYIGTVRAIGVMEIVLSDVVWVAASGKFQVALETGQLVDWMMYPDGAPVILGRMSVVDATPWSNPMPVRRNA